MLGCLFGRVKDGDCKGQVLKGRCKGSASRRATFDSFLWFIWLSLSRLPAVLTATYVREYSICCAHSRVIVSWLYDSSVPA